MVKSSKSVARAKASARPQRASKTTRRKSSPQSKGRSKARPAARGNPRATTKAPAKASVKVKPKAKVAAVKAPAKPVVRLQKTTAKAKPDRPAGRVGQGEPEVRAAGVSKGRVSAAGRVPAPTRPVQRAATKEAPKPKPVVKKKSPFDKKQLEVIRKQLDEMAADLRKELEEIEEAAFNLSQSEMSGEVSYDEDYADSGSFTFEREKDLSIANNVQDLLDKIGRSMEKIDEGTYGICEVCGNPIESARLKALPHALLCVRDKALEERR